MAKFNVLSPIKSGGKIYEIGTTITLGDEVAGSLLANGRIEPLGGTVTITSEAKGGADGKAGDASRQEAEPEKSAQQAGASAHAKKHSAKK